MISFRLSLFFAATFSIIGVQLPYWQLWLTGVGHTEGDATGLLSMSEIGLLIGAGFWARIFANPLSGMLADRLRDIRFFMFGLAILGMLSYIGFGFAQNFWILLVLSFILGLGLGPHIPLGDHLALSYVQQKGLHYGRMRLWGSLAFIITSTSVGFLLPDAPQSEADLSPILWTSFGLVALLAICSLFLPPPLKKAASSHQDKPVPEKTPASLWLILIGCGFSQMSHAVYYGYGSVFWRDYGIPSHWFGLLWSEAVIAEIVLFAFSAPLVARLGPVGLLGLAGFGGIVRWLGMLSADNLMVLIPLQTLHALTFGAAHLAAIYAIAEQVPPHRRARLQGINSAIFIALTSVIGLPLAGWLFEHYQELAYFSAAVPSFFAFVIFLIFLLRKKTLHLS